MSLNQKKVIEIILSELQSVKEICPGYREEIQDALVDIIACERQHRVQGTNVQQKVNDQIDAAGRYLTEQLLK